MESLIEELKKVKDFRYQQGQRHALWLGLLLVILGIMQGYLEDRAIGDFVKANQQRIIKNFNLTTNRVPSYSTIRRVMSGVDRSLLNQIFKQWASQLDKDIQGLDWLAVDGKSLKSTVVNYENDSPNFALMLSAYHPKNGLVLRVQQFENKKGSAIQQVQALVRDGSFVNKVFTLDALHCQTETTRLIIESGNHYLITVKMNQPLLAQQIVSLTNS